MEVVIFVFILVVVLSTLAKSSFFKKSTDSHDALQRINPSTTGFNLDQCKCGLSVAEVTRINRTLRMGT